VSIIGAQTALATDRTIKWLSECAQTLESLREQASRREVVIVGRQTRLPALLDAAAEEAQRQAKELRRKQ
jgi:hypothetical protein